MPDTIDPQLIQTGVRISELPPAAVANDTDEYEINSGGVSYKVTRLQIVAGLQGDMTAALALKANIDSPNLTGTPTAPTVVTGVNTDTRIANVATVINQFNLIMPGYATINSPTFTGDPKAPTPATGDNDTSIATTAFVKAQNYITSAGAPVQSVAGKTGVVTLVKGDVGLGNVDNTSDANKPVSTATQTALNLKSDLASPTFTGDPKAPTPATADNDTSIATTAFVKAQAYATVTYVDAADALKAPLASPALTGNPTAPTPTAGDNDTSIATTAFVTAAIAGGGLSAKFNVRATAADTISGAATLNVFRTLATPVEDYDPDGVWDNSTGTFAAPSAGRYHFDAHLYATCNPAGQVGLYIQHQNSGGSLIRNYGSAANTDQNAYGADKQCSLDLQMASGEKIQFVWASTSSGTTITTVSGTIGGTSASLIWASGQRIGP